MQKVKKGYYLVLQGIPPLVGLAYCTAGGDEGFTKEEAIRQQKKDPQFVVINKQGHVVFPCFIIPSDRDCDDKD
jgi:hypothetical protein